MDDMADYSTCSNAHVFLLTLCYHSIVHISVASENPGQGVIAFTQHRRYLRYSPSRGRAHSAAGGGQRPTHHHILAQGTLA